MSLPAIVHGPAYLDRVVRFSSPLGEPRWDLSVDGELTEGVGLTLLTPSGAVLEIEPPPGWPGPAGAIRLSRDPGPLFAPTARAIGWHDDLGGMGAGYARAFGAPLVHALGSESDPQGLAIARLLASEGIVSRPVHVPGRTSDWTLLLTSGEHGDKLPIGFRGCHAGLDELPPPQPATLRVVAALPNRLIGPLLAAEGASVRFLAPSLRNMTDRDVPLATLSHCLDALCCNRQEWEALEDRGDVAARLSLLAVTEGPRGARVWFRTVGGRELLHVPAFPREAPPRDTNRAGEAFASTLIGTLLAEGWRGGPLTTIAVRHAARRASVAAALVLDRADFGFPGEKEIREALQVGRVRAVARP